MSKLVERRLWPLLHIFQPLECDMEFWKYLGMKGGLCLSWWIPVSLLLRSLLLEEGPLQYNYSYRWGPRNLWHPNLEQEFRIFLFPCYLIFLLREYEILFAYEWNSMASRIFSVCPKYPLFYITSSIVSCRSSSRYLVKRMQFHKCLRPSMTVGWHLIWNHLPFFINLASDNFHGFLPTNSGEHSPVVTAVQISSRYFWSELRSFVVTIRGFVDWTESKLKTVFHTKLTFYQ